MNRTPQLLEDVAPGEERSYLPGMGKDWLLPLYDPLTRLVGIHRRQRRLIELAALAPGQKLLDVGCGTGNLLQTIARDRPGLELAGLDPDRKALARAARKLRRAAGPGTSTTLIHGYGDRLPFPDGSLDRVISTMALHHLDTAARQGFAAEAYRVLRSGGRIAILDFGGPVGHSDDHGHHHHRDHGRMWRRSVASPEVQQNLGDGLPRLLRDAGFVDAAEVDHEDSRMSPFSYVLATRP